MDEMKTYHIMPANHTLEEAKALLEEVDFQVIGELKETYIDKKGYLGAILLVKGNCDPVMIFDDMLVSHHQRIGNYYVW